LKVNYLISLLEIREAFKPFFAASSDEAKPIKPLYAGSSGDGEYLIRRGTYTIGANPKDWPFEQIYKKTNGNYLLYHDEFEFSS
jgi:hypothetical protein